MEFHLNPADKPRDYFIRKATQDDLDQLVNLENQCFTSDKMSRRSYQTLLKKSSADIIIAELNHIIIASATIFYRKNSLTARLYSIAVDNHYRKHGIAAVLCDRVEQLAKQHGCNCITLEVRVDNQPAIQFYKKHLYETFGMYEQFYEDGTDAMRMKKILGDPSA
jgi:ribosomal protein S18 acetylase RimI-like enzyme